MPTLVWGFFTPMLPATAPEVCPPHTRSIKMKGKQHGQYILETKHGVFTPLILSSYGGMGSEAQTFYKRLANLLSLKHDVPYNILMGCLRCKLYFAFLRSAAMCIRGSRSSIHHTTRDPSDIVLACRGLCATEILTLFHSIHQQQWTSFQNFPYCRNIYCFVSLYPFTCKPKVCPQPPLASFPGHTHLQSLTACSMLKRSLVTSQKNLKLGTRLRKGLVKLQLSPRNAIIDHCG